MSVPATDIVRVTAHPADTNIVQLAVPHSCNELMGRYEPAQFSAELRCYLLHVALLDSFERFATYAGLYVLDERVLSPVQATRQELCDVCNRPRGTCQTAAGNRGALHDHAFVSVAQATAERAK